ncbi:MAG: flagellar basal body P-ring protein FlgI [Planctomycetaceae bacterium]|nr:flagellar basal body P-ring protein FlgI [Planctomycetaceae bacterium]
MPSIHAPLAAGLCLLAALTCGCYSKKMVTRSATSAPAPQVYLPDTISRHARLIEGAPVPMRGYCVVVGLGKNGSTQVPGALQKYLVQYLLKEGRLSSYFHGTQDVSPARFLADLDTAVVQVTGLIPPGAPRGMRIDVEVKALGQTDTKSLEGGTLMPAEMRLAIGDLENAGQGSTVQAMAGGPVFVNPFLDHNKTSDLIKFREGVIIGGGQVIEARPVRLSLVYPDFAMCQLIQRRINERFAYPNPVAAGKDSSMLELTIPPDMQDDYRHFVDLVLHLPLRTEIGTWEQIAREMLKAIDKPGSRYEDYSLTWEAMGRQVISIIRPAYRSRNPITAYYTARAGLRLGDAIAADVILFYAQDKRAGLQMEAIGELGRHRNVARAALVLHQLLDDEDDLVRQAAYEALDRRGDRTVITRVKVCDDFDIDLVATKVRPAIYVSRTLRQRLVLFGGDLPVRLPLFYDSPDHTVTINAKPDQNELSVFRKLPRSGEYSDILKVKPTVKELVLAMGSPPQRDADGNMRGLWLTYSQIVSVLYHLCKGSDINARFNLQTPSALSKSLYQHAPGAGRPDTQGTP